MRGVEMNNERDLILKEEVHRIVGCGMEVLNVLGHGFLLKVTGQEVGVILNFKPGWQLHC